MLTTRLPTTQPSDTRRVRHDLLVMEAQDGFRKARRKANLSQILQWLRGGGNRLEELDSVGRSCRAANRYHAGVKKVDVRLIRGSESRSQDFDLEFNPRADRVGRRWQDVFKAYQEGVSLPPVDLVEIAGRYYVRDGHHRISVARALGQTYVDAVVTVWQTEGCKCGVKGV